MIEVVLVGLLIGLACWALREVVLLHREDRQRLLADRREARSRLPGRW